MPGMKEVFSFLTPTLVEDGGKDPKNPNTLMNFFSRTFSEYKYRVDKASERAFGKNWKVLITQAAKCDPQRVDKWMKDMWDVFFTDSEAFAEISFWVDQAQQPGQWEAYNSSNPDNMPKPTPKKEFSPADDEYEGRPSRAIGVSPSGDLIFAKQGR